MAMDPRALDQYGTPFWVHFDLSNPADTYELVVPKPVKTQPTPIAGGAAYELSGLVLTGIHYHLHAGADNEGFTLQAVDYQVDTDASPPTTLTIFNAEAHTTDRVSYNSISCFLPLTRAGLPLNTPSAGVQNGSKIQVTNVNGGNCTGSLLIEGFHTTHSFGGFATTGSPQVFA